MRAYRAAHKAEFAARRKPLVGEAREKHRAYMHVYYRENKHKYSTEASRPTRKRHYDKHRVRLLAEQAVHRQAIQDYINEVKSRTCQDCGVLYPPYVMDFDHVRGVKKFQIGGGQCRAMASIVAEIAKCDIVCSNCHRFRTFRNRPLGKYVATSSSAGPNWADLKEIK